MPRYECGIEGLEANWVQVSDAWTRREAQELVAADEEHLLAIYRAKVVACHLETAAGVVVDDPKALTVEMLDDMDVRLIRFLGTVLLQAINHLQSLGNLSGRLSSNGAGMAVAPSTPTKTPEKATRHRRRS